MNRIKNNAKRAIQRTKDITKYIYSDRNFWVYGVGCPPPSIIYNSIKQVYHSRGHRKRDYD